MTINIYSVQEVRTTPSCCGSLLKEDEEYNIAQEY
jgi:hypothetical protein